MIISSNKRTKGDGVMKTKCAFRLEDFSRLGMKEGFSYNPSNNSIWWR